MPPPRHTADPVNSERLYQAEEAEFLKACELYRERRHRTFLRATDYLTVLKSLGYTKGPATGTADSPDPNDPTELTEPTAPGATDPAPDLGCDDDEDDDDEDECEGDPTYEEDRDDSRSFPPPP